LLSEPVTNSLGTSVPHPDAGRSPAPATPAPRPGRPRGRNVHHRGEHGPADDTAAPDRPPGPAV